MLGLKPRQAQIPSRGEDLLASILEIMENKDYFKKAQKELDELRAEANAAKGANDAVVAKVNAQLTDISKREQSLTDREEIVAADKADMDQARQELIADQAALKQKRDAQLAQFSAAQGELTKRKAELDKAEADLAKREKAAKEQADAFAAAQTDLTARTADLDRRREALRQAGI